MRTKLSEMIKTKNEVCKKSCEKIAESDAAVAVKNIKEDTLPCAVQLSKTIDQKNSTNLNNTNIFCVQGIHEDPEKSNFGKLVPNN